jgi:hypothetical protein
MSSCFIKRNAEGLIEQVLAPNGEESKLFSNLLSHPHVMGDVEAAARLWAQSQSLDYKESKKDDNGEPLASEIPIDEQAIANSSSNVYLASAHSVLSEEKLQQFKTLQQAGLISKRTFTAPNGKQYYTIPKTVSQKSVSNEFAAKQERFSYYEKDHIKREVLEKKMEQYGINWLNIRETDKAYLIEVSPQLNMLSADQNISVRPAKQPTIVAVRNFLKNIGISEENIKTVSTIIHDGAPVQAFAMADILNKSIQIANGKEDITLPEEGMHFLVELLKLNQPELHSLMRSKIRDYQIYKDIVNSPVYTESPFYRRENGSLDIDKIKDEAIAKVLAEYTISRLENEILGLALQAKGFFSRLIDWIKSIFGSIAKNPFDETAIAIAEGAHSQFGSVDQLSERGVFLAAADSSSIKDRDQQFQENKELFTRIRTRPQQLGITKQGSDYYINGVKGEHRVSDDVQKFYDQLFRNKIIPEDMKPFYEQTRNDGTLIHEIIEDVIKRSVDAETGLLRNTMGPVTGALTSNPLAEHAYNYLGERILGIINRFPEGTRFMSEQVIYDQARKKFGTIDLLAIEPNGKTSILDWKTITFEDYNKNTGIKEYKEQAFDIQIKEYRRILEHQYGVEHFGMLRAIPILKQYKSTETTVNGKKERITKLSGIRMGSGTPIEIKDEALRPVISTAETTGIPEKDAFVSMLEEVKKEMKARFKNNQKFDPFLYETLKKAIYEMRVSNEVDGFMTHVRTQMGILTKVLADIETNKDNYSQDQLNNVSADLNYHEKIFTAFRDIGFLADEEDVPPEVKQKLVNLISNIDKRIRAIERLRKELLNKLAEKEGVFTLLKPEKIVGFWSKWARSMSQSSIASVQTLYKLAAKVFSRLEVEDAQDLHELQQVHYNTKQWAKNNGTTVAKALKKLLHFNSKGEWNGQLISKIHKDFYTERTEILKTRDKEKILDWWDKNYDLSKYVAWYKGAFEKAKTDIHSSRYSEDEEENARIIESRIASFEKQYNIEKHPFEALNARNVQVWSKNIKIDNWHSDEYKELLKPENKELLATYNHFQKMNEKMVESGVIEAWRQNTFVPNIRASFAEAFAFENSNIFSKAAKGLTGKIVDFKESLKVGDHELHYNGTIDPITGEKVDEVYAAYVSDIGEWVKDDETGKNKLSYSKKSKDLFTVYAMMNRSRLKYQYLKGIEDISQGLLHLEEHKKNLESNKFGKIVKENGVPVISKEEGKNLKALKMHVQGVVYGRSLQDDSDTFIPLNRKKFAEWWNKTPMGKIVKMRVPEGDDVTRISLTKFLMRLNNFNQIRILGLNLSSVTSNLFGGSAMSRLMYKDLFTNKDLTAAMFKISSGAWYATDEMKKTAALIDYFLPLMDNRDSWHAHQLSASATVRFMSQDWLMGPQRKTDEIVETNLFLAVIANTMVRDGKLVNIRKYVQSQSGWDQRFNLDQKSRLDLEKRVEKQIEDIKTKEAVAKIATFEDRTHAGKTEKYITIPGLDRNSDTVHAFRESIHTLTKDALGNMTGFDSAGYKYNLMGRMIMSFKNWIPRQADVRFGEFRYDAGHDAYEWGRFRMFVRGFSSSYFASVAKLVPFLGRGMAKWEDKTYLIDRAKELYQEKKTMLMEMGLYNEKNFISEGEFIDKFIQGLNAEFTEMRTIFMFMAVLISGIILPDKDDDNSTKNFKKRMQRQTDKLMDELSFFYNPNSFLDVIGSSPLPVMNFVTNSYHLIYHFNKEMFGQIFHNQTWIDQAKPTKYLFKAFPASKIMVEQWLPIMDPDAAKALGISVTTNNSNR